MTTLTKLKNLLNEASETTYHLRRKTYHHGISLLTSPFKSVPYMISVTGVLGGTQGSELTTEIPEVAEWKHWPVD